MNVLEKAIKDMYQFVVVNNVPQLKIVSQTY